MNAISRKAFYCVFCLFVFVFLLFTDHVVAQQKPEGNGPVGTWKLVSTKYADAKDFTKYTGPSSRLKIINPTHFTWVEVDQAKRVSAMAGGRYTLSGNNYTETIDFAGAGME